MLSRLLLDVGERRNESISRGDLFGLIRQYDQQVCFIGNRGLLESWSSRGMAALTPILAARPPDEPERFQKIQVEFTGQDLLDCQSPALLESS